MPYNFKIRHRSGIGNPADYLSRQPVFAADTHCDDAEDYVNYVLSSAIPKSISHAEIIKATEEDESLKELIRRIRGTKVNLAKRQSAMYDHVFHELSVTNDNVVLRNQKIVIPSSLQSRVVDIAHEGHQGFTKTKELLRTKVWFPQLDKLVDQKIHNCHACQINHPRTLFEPLRMSDMPSGPWERLSMDFWGPTPSNTDLLIIIDEYSRYALVEEVSSKSAVSVIPILHKVWSMFGIPTNVKTDNGPPFNSCEFESMCKFFGITHRHITPYWPRANGEVERFNRNLNKVMRNSAIMNTPWKKELNLFLGAYRATPHTSTGVAPASLIFKFNSTCRLASLAKVRKFERTSEDDNAIKNDELAKIKMKANGDKNLHVVENSLSVGDLVYYQSPRGSLISKTKPLRELDLYKITAIKNSNITAISTVTNHQINRNSSEFRKANNQSTADSGLQNFSFDLNIPVKTGEETQTAQSSFNSMSSRHTQSESTIQHRFPENNSLGTRTRTAVKKLNIDPTKKSYA